MPPLRMRAMLAEAALQRAAFVLLDPQEHDVGAGRILTWCWNSEGWTRQLCGLPDVVIIFGKPLEPRQEALIAWVQATRPFIADKGISKLELCDMLPGTECEPYLIPSAKIPERTPGKMLASFLQTHRGAVVKRADGNRGVGLYFVTRGREGWNVNCDGKTYSGMLEGASEFVATRIAGRLRYREFIAQKYIRSVAADDRPADVRVHVQRRAGGEWGVTRAYVRLAEAGMPLANTSRGGYQGALEGFLAQRKARSANEVEAEFRQAAIRIACIQEAKRTKPLSELGIDFLIDEDDRIWVVETNALPQSFLHEHERAVHAIGYARYIAENWQLSGFLKKIS